MLSLSSLLNTEPTAPAHHPMDDRGEHYSYPPPCSAAFMGLVIRLAECCMRLYCRRCLPTHCQKGGSSKGKKGSQTVLSALTLLAFLFFLNILQSALQEQMDSNAPIIVMMTTTTSTTTTVEGQRQKREEPVVNSKGDTGLINNNRETSGCPPQDCESSSVRTTIDSPIDQP